MVDDATPGDGEVAAFLARVEPPGRSADAAALIALMRRVAGEPPRMWGPSIVGFGREHYRYDSGREGDTFRIGFSPRKPQLVLYLSGAVTDDAPLLATLGRHTTGKACLYIKRLADVDMVTLEALVASAWERTAAG
jgi:hypothetical protein